MFSRLQEPVRRFAGPLTVGCLLAGGLASVEVFADQDQLKPPHNHWSHDPLVHPWNVIRGLKTPAFDSASIRRGYEVYRQVCSTCHAMKHLHFRNLVGVSHTKEQATALAASIEVEDGPNDEGEMFTRKGRLVDGFPAPYKNKEQARATNNGAVPPDLSCISRARHHGSDYIFALLTGYGKEPPAGYNKPGLYYNPYFDGGAISMKPPLSDGIMEYEDGTPATVSQMAKDVSTFLDWASMPELNERRRIAFQATWVGLALVAVLGYNKRFAWASLKTRRISWIDVKGRAGQHGQSGH